MGALLLLLLVLTADPDPRPVVAAHRACKYDQRAEACTEALKAYPAYLARAPTDSKLRYFYAELLWDQHRFAEAAVQYREAAADQTAPFSESAAYAAVLARREAVGPHPRRRHDGKPWPLTSEVQALVDAADFYMAHHPRGAHVAAVAVTAAFEYFHADDLDEAERRAKRVLELELEEGFARNLLQDIAARRLEPPEPAVVQPIGTPQTIGEPQTIGGADDVEDDCGETVEEQ